MEWHDPRWSAERTSPEPRTNQKMAQDATRSGVEGLNEEGKEDIIVNDDFKEILPRIRRFDDKSDKPNGAQGRATRAMRDLEKTGLLPASAFSIIWEFATGK